MQSNAPNSALIPFFDLLRGFAADRPALFDLDAEHLTYGDLSLFLDQTARTLNGAGFGRGSRAAIVMPNGSHMATLFLAVASTMTAAPLNPNYPLEEFRFYLHDLRASVLLILQDMESPAREAARLLNIPIIEVEPLPGKAGIFSLTIPNPTNAPAAFNTLDDLALILHTSGTTSRPKIVPLTLRNLVASARNIRETLCLTPADRCLNIMPLFHIHGLIGALLASLTAGASVVCTPGLFAPEFSAWLDRFQPTWYTAVPTMHQAILTRIGTNGVNTRLRFIRSSSAALPPSVLDQLEAAFDAPVIEAYGMTEAAHQMASNPLPPAIRKPGSVGKPFGLRIAILDEAGSLLPPETPGEIAIQGENVTSGYENAPEVNANTITNGWLRTGDQGRLDADGYLFITGRLKELINRGGEKVSPREVDEALLSHPAVAQAAAFALPHPLLGEDVAAVIVLRPAMQVSEPDLRAFVSERLAYYKVPRQIVFRDEIPKGATGKIQRIQLAAQLGITAQTNTRARREFVAPRTPLERDVAALWSEVLHVELIGVTDDFLDLGGDSMLALLVVHRLRASFGVALDLRHVLATPTVADLALLVTKLQADQMAGDDLQALLASLDTLSDDEAQNLLE